MIHTSTHSTETEIFSDELFKIVFHELLPAFRNINRETPISL